MFERFTPRARRVVELAHDEARLLNQNYIGTEHILLGLVKERRGAAGTVLDRLGISIEAVRTKVETIRGEGSDAEHRHIPFTPRAKKVLELSQWESRQLDHNYVGTEHILLGLVREGEGVGAQVLVSLGAELPRVRQEVVQLLSGSPSSSAAPVSPSRFAQPSGFIQPRETPAAARVGVEARRLAAGGAVGSQHYLLGLLQGDDSMAARALADLGITRAAIEAKLGDLNPTGTTDETPEEAGARRISLRVKGPLVILELDDPELAASLEKAITGRPLRIITGTDPEAVGFPALWTAVSRTVEDLTRRLTTTSTGPVPRRTVAPYWRPDALDPTAHAGGYWIVNQPGGAGGYLEIAPGLDRDELRTWLGHWLDSHRSGLARPGGRHEATGCCTLWVVVDGAPGAFAVSGYGFGTVGPPGSEPIAVEDLVAAAIDDLASPV